MSEIFKHHLEKFIELSEQEFEYIFPFFTIQSFKKKENLISEGQLCKSHYFVLEGCLRKFFINEKGAEQTIEFALETWWMTDTLAYEHGLPTDFYIQAIENSVILTINREDQELLLKQFPKMERYFRFVYQRAYGASQMRIKYLFSLSKEDFYHQFNQRYPAFVQRIPQYLLASFLGLTPEYLSEIRSKNRS